MLAADLHQDLHHLRATECRDPLCRHDLVLNRVEAALTAAESAFSAYETAVAAHGGFVPDHMVPNEWSAEYAWALKREQALRLLRGTP